MAISISPPDYNSPIGALRNVINDVEQHIDPLDPGADAEYLFSDDRLQAFLTLNKDSIRLAAADAIDAIADNESLVSKKIRTEDLQTDGPSVTNALRMHATSLRLQARQEAEAEDDADAFEIVDFQTPTPWPFPTPDAGVLGWL